MLFTERAILWSDLVGSLSAWMSKTHCVSSSLLGTQPSVINFLSAVILTEYICR
jgi:hypothetical protein